MLADALELDRAWKTEDHGAWRLHDDEPEAAVTTFARSVLDGLTSDPRTLDCQWLYDAEGSALYEQITETMEYYPTRTEDRILADNAAAIRSLVGDAVVVELGSGSSTKTRHILDAWAARGPFEYAAIDVSDSALRGALAGLALRYPQARLEGLATTYARGLSALGAVSPKVVVFLGSTLGNYDPDGMRAFLEQVAEASRPGDHLLLGLDRVKPARVLEAAYDDARGVTRQFILNLFARMNRELGTDVPLDALRYEARWNPVDEQVEMWVHVLRDLDVHVEGQGIELRPGDAILVEISRKFRPERVAAVAHSVGLEQVGHWTDPDAWFSELLFRRV